MIKAVGIVVNRDIITLKEGLGFFYSNLAYYGSVIV